MTYLLPNDPDKYRNSNFATGLTAGVLRRDTEPSASSREHHSVNAAFALRAVHFEPLESGKRHCSPLFESMWGLLSRSIKRPSAKIQKGPINESVEINTKPVHSRINAI